MDSLIESTPLFLTGVFVMGLLIGSFLNVVILRVPRLLEFDWKCQCMELLEIDAEQPEKPPGIFLSRSRCQKCGHGIRAWENIPVISYLLLRGKCAACNGKISLRYPLVELATGVLFAVVAMKFGPNAQTATALLLTACLVALTVIDIDHHLLPDNLTVPLMWAGILLSLWSIHTDLVSSVIGAVAGYMVLWTIYHLFRLLTGKEGMGYGDFKLLAAVGAWLGWQSLPLVILLSSIVGAIVGLSLMATGKLDRGKPLPFGPFIAAAGWIALIWGEQITGIYLNGGTFG